MVRGRFMLWSTRRRPYHIPGTGPAWRRGHSASAPVASARFNRGLIPARQAVNSFRYGGVVHSSPPRAEIFAPAAPDGDVGSVRIGGEADTPQKSAVDVDALLRTGRVARARRQPTALRED